MKRIVWGVGMLLAFVGCTGSNTPMPPATPTAPSPPTTPTPPPVTSSATIVITRNNTFQPAEVRVLVGGRVTFINENNRAHDITSDPPHLHTDCPAVMEVGFIQPGQTKQTGVLDVARECGFHDHMQETNSDLRGKIIIQGTSQ